MKFLVFWIARETFYAQTGSVVSQIVTAASDILKRQMEQGIILERYYTFEGHAVVCIYKCQSHEELMKYLYEVPGSGYYETKIYPLVDYDETMDVLLGNVERTGSLHPGGTVK